MEGFEKKKVEKILEVNTDEYEVAVLVALGYRAGPQSHRARWERDALIEYR